MRWLSPPHARKNQLQAGAEDAHTRAHTGHTPATPPAPPPIAQRRAEIVSLGFSMAGDLIITGSFDHDSRLWDVRTGQCVHVLSGHRGEVSSTMFNYSGAWVSWRLAVGSWRLAARGVG